MLVFCLLGSVASCDWLTDALWRVAASLNGDGWLHGSAWTSARRLHVLRLIKPTCGTQFLFIYKYAFSRTQIGLHLFVVICLDKALRCPCLVLILSFSCPCRVLSCPCLKRDNFYYKFLSISFRQNMQVYLEHKSKRRFESCYTLWFQNDDIPTEQSFSRFLDKDLKDLHQRVVNVDMIMCRARLITAAKRNA